VFVVMNRTSITLGEDTRNALREYKHDRDLPNYDAALRDLLDTENATA
jgi:hypothetical protein